MVGKYTIFIIMKQIANLKLCFFMAILILKILFFIIEKKKSFCSGFLGALLSLQVRFVSRTVFCSLAEIISTNSEVYFGCYRRSKSHR